VDDYGHFVRALDLGHGQWGHLGFVDPRAAGPGGDQLDLCDHSPRRRRNLAAATDSRGPERLREFGRDALFDEGLLLKPRLIHFMTPPLFSVPLSESLRR
jgi:hypothetical protein